MPIIKAQKKSLRQDKKREERNRKVKTEIKKSLKTALAAIELGKDDVSEQIKVLQKKLDKAAKKNVFSKNKAARKLKQVIKKAKTAKNQKSPK